MEGDQNLSAIIKLEPIEIKSETKDELLVGISDGQEFEDTTGPILGPGVIKTEPIEIKSEPKDEPVFEFTVQDVFAGGQKIKEESDKDSLLGRPKDPEIQADNQSVFHALDDKEGLVMNYKLGESQSAESESVDLSTLYKSIKWTMVEEKDEPEFVNLSLSKVNPSGYTILESNRVQCNYCATSLESAQKFRQHIRKNHSDIAKVYKCPFCPHTSKHGVSRHITSKHKSDSDIQYFVCHTCGRKFKFKDNLTRHFKCHRSVDELMQTNEIYKCERCSKIFRYKHSFINHPKYCNNKNDDEPGSRQNLMYNMQKHPLNYPECDFTPKFLVDFNEPKIPQKKEKKYKCNKCDYRTYHSANLKDHGLTHLKPEEIQYFYCYHCNFKAKWRSRFIAHIKRHFQQEEVEFECHICDFKTKKRQIYSCHIGEHNKKLKS